MITAAQVAASIEEHITGTDMFMVEVKVHPGNRIEVEIDADEGLPIERCRSLHRHIEKSFDREVEDYSLTVGSPGLDEPLKVQRQYTKNIGRNVTIKTSDGKKTEGELKSAAAQHITISTKLKEVVPGKKNKQWVERDNVFPYTEIKEAKIVISFK
ncbi:MAG: ribosome assembly cofactor RimP [Flavobacteriales bacterium]|nr:ribosome assembly cofactor RimP [Flavobacteriales bacterium]